MKILSDELKWQKMELKALHDVESYIRENQTSGPAEMNLTRNS